jgi:hypothetical protein
MKAVSSLSLWRWAALAALIGVLVACQHAPGTPTPATLSISTTHAACLQQIQAAIANDLGQPVRLTEAAFAQSASLSISPTEILDPQGRVAQGRIRGLPELYQLRKINSNCELVRSATGATTVLSACSCMAAQQ